MWFILIHDEMCHGICDSDVAAFMEMFRITEMQALKS